MKQILTANRKIYTVSGINEEIRAVLEYSRELQNVQVRGELSAVNSYQTYLGPRIYFTLKETRHLYKKGQDEIFLLYGYKDLLPDEVDLFQPKMSVTVTGNITFDPRKGTSRIIATRMEPEGIGKDAENLALLREKLKNEGLFDVSHKKTIPDYFTKVGIISTKKAQGYEDFVNNTRVKNPFIKLYLVESIMQGQKAVESIIRGVEILDSKNLDMIIITRGGGSEDEMQFFNDEALARKIFECKTPVVSAVGHHRFEPILNDVADKVCSTPSAIVNDVIWSLSETLDKLTVFERIFDDKLSFRFAKLKDQVKMRWLELEKENPVRKAEQYLISLDHQKSRIETMFLNKFSDYQRLLKEEKLKLENNNPKRRIAEIRLKLEREEEKLFPVMNRRMEESRVLLNENARKMGDGIKKKFEKIERQFVLLVQALDGLSPLKRLQEGYSYTETPDGKNLRSIEQIKVADKIKVSLSDGKVLAKVEEVYDGRGKNIGEKEGK